MKIMEPYQHSSVFAVYFEQLFIRQEIGVQHLFKVTNNDHRKALIESELYQLTHSPINLTH